jgi:hypothetical protein
VIHISIQRDFDKEMKTFLEYSHTLIDSSSNELINLNFLEDYEERSEPSISSATYEPEPDLGSVSGTTSVLEVASVEGTTSVGLEILVALAASGLNSVSPLLSESEVEEFTDGFFEGVSSVPYDQNKCKIDIIDEKIEIISVFRHLIVAIKTQTNIMEAFEQIYQLTLHLIHLDSNCHFRSLSYDLAELATKLGMSKLVFRVTTHFISFMEDLKGLYTNFEVKDYRNSGKDFGYLTKIALNYSTI